MPNQATTPPCSDGLKRQPLRRWLLKQVLFVGGITLLATAALVLLYGRSPLATLAYSFFISLSCAMFVQGLRLGLSWLLVRLGRVDEATLSGWPGWPAMIACLLLGTFLGYGVGNEIGNLVTGYNEAGLHDGTLRRSLSIMLFSLVPGFALTFYFVGRSRVELAEAQAQTLQRQAAEAQLRLLESQLEPHMLFNTLANLRVLIGIDPPRAQAMLDRLIAFLRATLAASRTGSHSLAEEFARLSDYLALMQIRMGARLQPRLELPDELAQLQIPPLLLQPLVENAIKHGLEPHVEGGELAVSATREGAQLVLRVRDTGVGLSQSGTSGTRFGLEQVRARLAAQYGDAASFMIECASDARGGTLATLRLPLPT